ncbi:hypothetical protein CR513_13862, partial [Mucuna pruriens]
MANSKLGFMITYIFLSIMIFNGTFSALGRPLKSEMKDQVTTHQNIIKEIAKAAEYTDKWHDHTLAFESSTVDDFQPTDPGHSPGAGHSSPHANVVPKP